MEIIAIGLANHNLLAYLFIIILLEPPIVIIILEIITKIKNRRIKNENR